jgi:hypothetical protein
MAVSRYQKDTIIGAPRRLSTAAAVLRIRQSINAGLIPTRELVLAEGQRLDHLAGNLLGDGRLWWVLAATSNIGWGLQVPPGTRLLVPIDIGKVLELV